MSTVAGAPLQVSVGVLSLCSPLEVGADRAADLATSLSQVLRAAGCTVLELGRVDTGWKAAQCGRRCAAEGVQALAAVSASWYEDYLVLDLLEEWRVPILLWSTPGMETGALCGNQQLTCCLKQLGWAYGCVYGEVEDPGCLERAVAYLQAAGLRARLRRARVGLAGQRIGGMTHTSPHEFALKRVVGPRVVPLDVPLLLKRATELGGEEAERLWEQMKGRAGECRVADADGVDSMAVYRALREVVEAEGLDAITVGCYPHLMGRVCLAASLLADEGVPMGCEGDVNGAVAQLILQLLTGQPTHHTDWLNPLEDGSVVFTHCGSGSLCLAENPQDITLTDVRLMGQGVCALFPARPGPVTLLSLVPSGGGYQMALLEGEALSTGMVFPGNPVRVRFPRDSGELIEWVHREGVGHHWAIGYGHVGAQVRAWAQMAGPQLRLVQA